MRTRSHRLSIILCLISVILPSLSSQSSEWVIKYESGQGTNDVRMKFKLDILDAAMAKTSGQYGSYEIVNLAPSMNGRRAIDLLQRGDKLNVYIAVTNREWEEKTIPIRIPIRRGVLNYRLLLIDREKADAFARVERLDDLLEFKAGSQLGWTTTGILENNGFSLEVVSGYDSLFQMLNYHRFDFLPRGVNEVFAEFELKKEMLEHVIIEPNLALYIPGATYVFVSPRYPQLAERLKKGLEIMVADGSLAKLVDEYFTDDLKRADLQNRRILYLENTELPPGTPVDNPDLWIDITDY